MKAITARQSEFLAFIDHHIAREGYAPSIREIMVALSLTSPNGVHEQLVALQEKGWIRRTPGIPRSIVVLAMPGPGDIAGGAA